MRRRQILPLLLSVLAAGRSWADEPSSAVRATKGSLPLLLTVPHDGGDHLGFMPVRRQGAVVRDAGTADLAERVASQLQARVGKRPYLVVARISRKFLDVNRPEAEALESPVALPAYRAYHDQVAAYVAELKLVFPASAVLIDVHGQSGEPNTTFRGTRGGLTTKALTDRFGPDALQGEKSLIGALAARGYQVHPAIGGGSLREDPRYAGGYTVWRYGSHRPDGIDAIQLEFGRRQRDNPALATDLAQALIAFMRQYQLLPA